MTKIRFTANYTIREEDFIEQSAGAADQSKAPVLNADGLLDRSFIAQLRFGGNGSDGPLAVASGVTNIDLGGAQVFVKNYTSISITGTGAVTFSNPHANGTTIELKSQGDVVLTSTATALLDATGMGALGGTHVAGGFTMTGGRGGAALYIECAGKLNFTGTIKNNGGDASVSGSATNAYSNSAGGAKGSTLILYNGLIANTGTSQCNDGAVAGGAGGTIGSGGTATNPNPSYGMYNTATAGTVGGADGELLLKWVQSSYSKYPQLVPSAGSSQGYYGNTGTNGSKGGTGGVNIVALNTEFV